MEIKMKVIGYRRNVLSKFFFLFFSSWKSDFNISHRILKFNLNNDGFSLNRRPLDGVSTTSLKVDTLSLSIAVDCSIKNSFDSILTGRRGFFYFIFSRCNFVPFRRFISEFVRAQLNTCARTYRWTCRWMHYSVEMWIDISRNTGLRWELAIFGTWKTAKPFFN